ncbi:MAG: hypothetical protein ACFFD1_03205 [Candidatus Thorarchaeota archaeon]
MNTNILNEKIAKQSIKEFIAQQKMANKTVVEAANISEKLQIPYSLVKEIFQELVDEGYLSSLEYIPA